jgi:hypothetical protein
MTTEGRAVLLALLLVAALALIARSRARPPPLGPPEAVTPCPVAVERQGEGVACLDEGSARAAGLAPGDRISPGGERSRMVPPRLELFAVPVDANHAPPEELASLPGIGPALAERIVRARPFRSLEEVAAVPGIGRRRLRALRDRLRLAPPPR